MNIAPLYTTHVLRLAASIPDPVTLGRVDGSADLRAPTCGSRVRCEVQIGGDGRVERLNQEVEACAFGQASAAIVAAGAAGRSHVNIATDLAELEAWLGGQGACPIGLPGYSALEPARSRVGRHGAILLPLRALLAAVEGSNR